MTGRNFHSLKNQNGIVAIRYNYKSATPILTYQSPYASEKTNDWLQHKLIKLYEAYYYKVLWETRGRFWKESDSAIPVEYTDTYGGKEHEHKI